MLTSACKLNTDWYDASRAQHQSATRTLSYWLVTAQHLTNHRSRTRTTKTRQRQRALGPVGSQSHCWFLLLASDWCVGWGYQKGDHFESCHLRCWQKRTPEISFSFFSVDSLWRQTNRKNCVQWYGHVCTITPNRSRILGQNDWWNCMQLTKAVSSPLLTHTYTWDNPHYWNNMNVFLMFSK